jgi:hypothetical protein
MPQPDTEKLHALPASSSPPPPLRFAIRAVRCVISALHESRSKQATEIVRHYGHLLPAPEGSSQLPREQRE